MTEQETMSQVTYRAFAGTDFSAAHSLSRRVEWPHRLEDWNFMMGLGQGFIAERARAVIGTAMVWHFGDAFASVGMVIVAPDQQGLGIGRRLMDAALAAAGKRGVLLNATVAGQPLYEKLGFRRCGEIHQHQGTAFGAPLVSLAPGERIRPTGASDGPILGALASRASGMAREAVIAALLDAGKGVVLDRDGKAAGFALFRRFGRGYAIGPVIADSTQGAQALIAHWVGSNPGLFLRIDVPAQTGLDGWLDQLGLAQVATVTSMMLGTPPRTAAQDICNASKARMPSTYALANQALG